jgi:hypothetical protein
MAEPKLNNHLLLLELRSRMRGALFPRPLCVHMEWWWWASKTSISHIMSHYLGSKMNATVKWVHLLKWWPSVDRPWRGSLKTPSWHAIALTRKRCRLDGWHPALLTRIFLSRITCSLTPASWTERNAKRKWVLWKIGDWEAVGIVTRVRIRQSEVSNPSRGEKFFSSPNRSDRLWGQSSLLFNGLPFSSTEVKRTGREADLSPPSSTEVEWKVHGVARDKSIFLHKPTNVSL